MGVLTHYIPAMEMSDVARTLHEGTRLGNVFPFDSLKPVLEMLWVPISKFLIWTHAWILKIYLSISSLWWRLVEILSVREHEEIAMAIFEYKDVFSPEDVGQTNLVMHSLTQECTDLYAYHPDDFPSLIIMWKMPKYRKYWTEELSRHARPTVIGQLFWLSRKMARF